MTKKEVKIEKAEWEYKAVEFQPIGGIVQPMIIKMAKNKWGEPYAIPIANELGKEGWELVNVFSVVGVTPALGAAITSTTSIVFIFKRRKK